MRQIRFELQKVFFHKFFLGMLAFALFLNLFALYQSPKTGAEPQGTATYSTYDQFLDEVQTNAENSLSVSIFSQGLSEFSQRNIKKTAEDFETMRGIQIAPDVDDGILMVFNSAVSDLCVLLLLIAVGFALIVDEKEKKLFHLIRSTRGGTVCTIVAKLGALLACCVIINTVITGSTALYAYFTYGFGDVSRSIQSIPELIRCFLHLDVLGFSLVLFLVRTAGIFIVGVLILLCCLLARRAITALLAVTVIGAGSVALTLIPETSALHFFKYINLYSLLNPYPVLKSYVNLNLFGQPVNVIAVFAVFVLFSAALIVAAAICCYVKIRPLENSDKKTRKMFTSSRARHTVRHFEWKKLFFLNKAMAILLLFAAFQIYSVYSQTNFQSSGDYYYQHYMQMLSGPLTEEKEEGLLAEKAEIDKAEKQMNLLNEQRWKGEITTQEFIQRQEQYADTAEKAEDFQRVYDRYLYVKNTPGAEFLCDSGYERLFGITDAGFSMGNTVLLLCSLSLCLCGIYSVDYKTEMYKVICATRYGMGRTRRAKASVSACAAALTFLLAYVPELIYIGRFYGFAGLDCALVSIPALSWLGGVPVWCGIGLLYLMRFAVTLLIVPIISAISLRSKNNIITAVICLLLFAVPIGIYQVTGIGFFADWSLWNLISGSVLSGASPVWRWIFQGMVLASGSVGCVWYIRSRFGKARV